MYMLAVFLKINFFEFLIYLKNLETVNIYTTMSELIGIYEEDIVSSFNKKKH